MSLPDLCSAYSTEGSFRTGPHPHDCFPVPERTSIEEVCWTRRYAHADGASAQENDRSGPHEQVPCLRVLHKSQAAGFSVQPLVVAPQLFVRHGLLDPAGAPTGAAFWVSERPARALELLRSQWPSFSESQPRIEDLQERFARAAAQLDGDELCCILRDGVRLGLLSEQGLSKALEIAEPVFRDLTTPHRREQQVQAAKHATEAAVAARAAWDLARHDWKTRHHDFRARLVRKQSALRLFDVCSRGTGTLSTAAAARILQDLQAVEREALPWLRAQLSQLGVPVVGEEVNRTVFQQVLAAAPGVQSKASLPEELATAETTSSEAPRWKNREPAAQTAVAALAWSEMATRPAPRTQHRHLRLASHVPLFVERPCRPAYLPSLRAPAQGDEDSWHLHEAAEDRGAGLLLRALVHAQGAVSSWAPGVPMARWHNVGTDFVAHTVRLSRLQLAGSNVCASSSQLVRVLRPATALRVLDLGRNPKLSGDIGEFGHMTRLEELRLERTSLSGTSAGLRLQRCRVQTFCTSRRTRNDEIFVFPCVVACCLLWSHPAHLFASRRFPRAGRVGLTPLVSLAQLVHLEVTGLRLRGTIPATMWTRQNLTLLYDGTDLVREPRGVEFEHAEYPFAVIDTESLTSLETLPAHSDAWIQGVLWVEAETYAPLREWDFVNVHGHSRYAPREHVALLAVPSTADLPEVALLAWVRSIIDQRPEVRFWWLDRVCTPLERTLGRSAEVRPQGPAPAVPAPPAFVAAAPAAAPRQHPFLTMLDLEDARRAAVRSIPSFVKSCGSVFALASHRAVGTAQNPAAWSPAAQRGLHTDVSKSFDPWTIWYIRAAAAPLVVFNSVFSPFDVVPRVWLVMNNQAGDADVLTLEELHLEPNLWINLPPPTFHGAEEAVHAVEVFLEQRTPGTVAFSQRKLGIWNRAMESVRSSNSMEEACEAMAACARSGLFMSSELGQLHDDLVARFHAEPGRSKDEVRTLIGLRALLLNQDEVRSWTTTAPLSSWSRVHAQVEPRTAALHVLTLDLSYLGLVLGTARLQQILVAVKNLVSLCLDGNSSLTGRLTLLFQLPRLESLSFRNCPALHVDQAELDRAVGLRKGFIPSVAEVRAQLVDLVPRLDHRTGECRFCLLFSRCRRCINDAAPCAIQSGGVRVGGEEGGERRT